MENSALSADGLWRWDGENWVRTEEIPLPPPPASPQSPSPLSTQPGTPLSIVALVTAGVAVTMALLQIIGDSVRSFGDHDYLSLPWYYSTWFVVVQFLVGAAALVLALLAVRRRGGLSEVALALAAAAFSQGLVQIYYRIVIQHFGLGLDV